MTARANFLDLQSISPPICLKVKPTTGIQLADNTAHVTGINLFMRKNSLIYIMLFLALFCGDIPDCLGKESLAESRLNV